MSRGRRALGRRPASGLAAACLLWHGLASAEDATPRFRYRADLQRCVDDRGEEGLNPPSRTGRDNECADYRGKLVLYLSVEGGNFRGANFDGAQFRYLNFMARVDLTGARLTRVEANTVDLRGADLSGADLSLARLKPCEPPGTGACLEGARFDARTVLPFPEAEALALGMVRIADR